MSDNKQEPKFRFVRNEEMDKIDYVVGQNYDNYTEEDHQIWRELYARQMNILKHRAVPELFENMGELKIDSQEIPRFEELSDYLKSMSGWSLVPVPGLIPAKTFFKHLANKRFPTTNWIRSRAQMDYLVEPDTFHDVFGHLPMLADPVFANYTEQYGKEAQKAMALSEKSGFDVLSYLTRVYWYTVEFGLIKTNDGLRIYGAGIQSSKTESIYSLESPKPRRLEFDLERMMRTVYNYADLQTNYFVVESYDDMLYDTRPKALDEQYKIILENPFEFTPNDINNKDRVIPPNTIKHFY